MSEQEREAREAAENAERATEAVLTALVRAHYDRRRPEIRDHGLEERDLAFEAGLLEPSEVEPKVYGTQKRRPFLRLLRFMRGRGLLELDMDEVGLYRVFPTEKGSEYARFSLLPWYRRVWDRLRGQKPPPILDAAPVEGVDETTPGS